MLVDTTDQTPRESIVAVFRPCEMRAVFELAKLHQINLDNITLISADCLGTLSVPEYTDLARNSKDDNITLKMMDEGKGGGASKLAGIDLRSACQICEFTVFDGADISILT